VAERLAAQGNGSTIPADGSVWPTAIYWCFAEIGTPPVSFPVAIDSGSGDLDISGKGCDGCVTTPPNQLYVILHNVDHHLRTIKPVHIAPLCLAFTLITTAQSADPACVHQSALLLTLAPTHARTHAPTPHTRMVPRTLFTHQPSVAAFAQVRPHCVVNLQASPPVQVLQLVPDVRPQGPHGRVYHLRVAVRRRRFPCRVRASHSDTWSD
jgi:hypothetical protein